MSVLKYELKKLICFRAVWLFVILCVLFNIFIISQQSWEYFNQISLTIDKYGNKINDKFIDNLKSAPETEITDSLIAAAENKQSGFSGYDAEFLSEYYGNFVDGSPTARRWIEEKYSEVGEQLERLSGEGADMYFYAGSVTSYSHGFLFGSLLKTISGESCIIAMLIMLYSLGYERIHRTELCLSATETGRRLAGFKVTAAAVMSIFFFAVISSVSLAVYFSLWDYRGIWDSNVSSSFNEVIIFLSVKKPFITWKSFTVLEYFVSVLLLTSLLVVTSALFSAAVGNLVSNTYIAALVEILILTAGRALTVLFNALKLGEAYLISLYQPLKIWESQALWFTDGGLYGIGKWYETKGLAAAFVIVLAAVLISLCWLRKKEFKGR